MNQKLEKIAEKYGLVTKYRLSSKSPYISVSEKAGKQFIKEFPVQDTKKLPKTIIKTSNSKLKIKINAKNATVIFDNDKLLGNENLKDREFVAKNGYITIPKNFPLGYHKLIVGNYSHFLISCPFSIKNPKQSNSKKIWGIVANLYSVRSKKSWGIGDFEDLKALMEKVVDKKGDFILINPLYVDSLGKEQMDSPYSPSSRIFFNPIYIRPNSLEHMAQLSATKKTKINNLHKKAMKLNYVDDIKRNTVWKYKKKALKIIYKNSATNIDEYKQFVKKYDEKLTNYIRWAIVKDKNKDPFTLSKGEIEKLVSRKQKRVEFYKWLLFVSSKQLEECKNFSEKVNMKIGIIQDLPTGVNNGSADVFANRDIFSTKWSIGLPPDNINNLGQVWGLSPLIPQKLVETGYEIIKCIYRDVFEKASAVRIDHAIGFFRSWWVLNNLGQGQGVFVKNDENALFGILLLEAHRAKGIVFGEVLGIKEKYFVPYALKRGMNNTFLYIEGLKSSKKVEYKCPNEIPKRVVLSLGNHDFSPTLGYLAGEHVKLKQKLKISKNSLEKDIANFLERKAAIINMLIRSKVLTQKDSTDDKKILEAWTKAMFNSPAEFIALRLTDIVGDKRTQNIPGTSKEYKNWRVPLTNEKGKLLFLEDIVIDK